MTNNQAALLDASRRFLPAIIRLLLPSGVNCRQFMELAKDAYVRVATEDFGRNGRPANVSRTAMLTGLTRVDVRKIRERLDQKDPTQSSDRRRYDLGTLLRDWHNDPLLLDDQHQPLVLAAEGTGATFKALVQRHFGDVPYTTILKELKNVEAVEERADGSVAALRDYYMPDQLSREYIERTGGLIADFINNVSFNLYRDKDTPSLVETRTVEAGVPDKFLPAFRAMLDDEATRLYRRVDQWLLDKKRFESSPEDNLIKVGCGVYQILSIDADAGATSGDGESLAAKGDES